MPEREKIGDIYVRFQFRLLAFGEWSLVRLNIEFGNPVSVMLRKVERDNIFGQRASHSVRAEIEYFPQYVSVSRRPRIESNHLCFTLRLSK